MGLLHLILPALLGVLLALVLGRKRWSFALGMAVILGGAGVAGSLLIEELSVEGFAKLPINGGTLAQITAWLLPAAVGLLIGLMACAGISLKNRGTTPKKAVD